MRGNRRPAVFAAAALTFAAALTGCASVVDGTGAPAVSTPGPSAPPSPSDPVTTAGTTAAPTAPTTPVTSETAPSSSVPAGSPHTPPDLASLLAPAPAGSHTWGNAWANNTAPSLAEFVAEVYPTSAAADARAELTHQGIREIVHRTWIAPGNQADEVLLRFATQTGAHSRYLSVSAAQAAAPGQHRFTVAGASRAVGFFDPKVDGLGNVRAIVYGQVGRIVMELFFYSPATFDKAGATASALEQLRRLPV